MAATIVAKRNRKRDDDGEVRYRLRSTAGESFQDGICRADMWKENIKCDGSGHHHDTFLIERIGKSGLFSIKSETLTGAYCADEDEGNINCDRSNNDGAGEHFKLTCTSA